MLDKLEIGIITTTHGLKGEVKVYPVTDDVHRFDLLDEVLVGDDRESTVMHAEGVRYFKNRPILKFKECGRIEEAERLKGKSIYVRRRDAVPLAEGEQFIGDLIGARAVLENGEPFGTLKDVLRTGANDVYEILTADGRSVYLPAIKDVILKMDPEQHLIVVRPMREI